VILRTARHFYRVQKLRVGLGLRIERLKKAGDTTWQFWENFYRILEREEEELAKRIEEYGKDHPLWEWASGIYGIGPLLFGQLMVELDKIGVQNFKSISALWRYCGLAVVDGKAQSRLNGQEALRWKFNRYARRVLHNLAECFVRGGREYRAIYDEARRKSESRHPDWNDGHHHNHAMRVVAKIFLAHLWVKARELYGLPVSLPYPQVILGHGDYIPPVEREKPLKERKRSHSTRALHP
jgi:hypothetical protein